MIVPLVVLAALSVVGGLVGPPMQEGGHAFERWLAPVFEHGPGAPAHGALPASTEWLLIVVSVAAAAAGIGVAFRSYLQQPELATRLQQRWSAAHRMLLNKYWVDELYQATVVRFTVWSANAFWKFWDEKVVDGTVNGVAYTIEGASSVLRLFQTGFVGTYALFFALGVVALLFYLVRL
jgi:NADH-quinone oxidoreductase subunit L